MYRKTVLLILVLVCAVCTVLVTGVRGNGEVVDGTGNGGTTVPVNWVDVNELYETEGYPYTTPQGFYGEPNGFYGEPNGFYTEVGDNYYILGGGSDGDGNLPEGSIASNPNPNDGEDEAAVDVVLSWTPGDFADAHNVFFSTDFDDVNEATGSASDAFQARVDTNSWDPGGLELNTIYYWRIDEIVGVRRLRGDVWSFTTATYLVIDDMESYDDPNDNIDNAIFNFWIDGTDNGTGSQVFLDFETVHGGEKSMLLVYDNNDANASELYSETFRNFEPTQDWTVFDVNTLSLWFYGDPNNDVNSTEQFYVGIMDGEDNYAEVRYGDNGEDMNDFNDGEWQRWDIDLEDFNSAGVDLTDVNSIHIGSGDPNEPVAGGSGFVYIDDIRLSLPCCIDFDGDGYGASGSTCCPDPNIDCDDFDPNVNPGAIEICDDGIDNDCDGLIDGNDPDCCFDADGDGYSPIDDTWCPYGGFDCNDSDANINPGAVEICNNGIDDNCDGLIDGEDPDCCINTPDFDLADIDDDCFVGPLDLQFITVDWLVDGNDANASPGNIYTAEDSGQIVNFRDFAVLAAKWFEHELDIDFDFGGGISEGLEPLTPP